MSRMETKFHCILKTFVSYLSKFNVNLRNRNSNFISEKKIYIYYSNMKSYFSLPYGIIFRKYL